MFEGRFQNTHYQASNEQRSFLGDQAIFSYRRQRPSKFLAEKKDFKIAPLTDYLNEKFKQFGILDENIAIDEQMFKYFGHSSFK